MTSVKITNIDLVVAQPSLADALGFGSATVVPWIGFYKGAYPRAYDLYRVNVTTFRKSELLWSSVLSASETTPGIWVVGEDTALAAAIFAKATWYMLAGKNSSTGVTTGVVAGDVSSLGADGDLQLNTVSFGSGNKYRLLGLNVSFPSSFSY